MMRRIAPRSVAAFLATMLVCAAFIFLTIRNTGEIEHLALERIILEKTAKINEVVSRLLYKTHILATLVVQKGAASDDFHTVAKVIADDPAILNLLLAPNGVVTQVYPLEGNEGVLGLDFFSDAAGNREAMAALERDALQLGGPFTLRQGGTALVGRLPVWVEDDGNRRFWGIVSVTLKYPDALAGADLDGLRDLGYYYEIWRINPDDNLRQTIAGNPELGSRSRSLEKSIRLFNADWHFRIAPVYEWYYKPENWALILGGLVTAALAGCLVQRNVCLRQMKEALEVKERDLQESVLAAQEANQMKSAFLANMSHEIRTPMNGIVGMAELAMDDAALPEATRIQLGKIRASSIGLLGILEGILDIAKIETGRVELERTPFELQDVFALCETVEKAKAEDKRLALHFYAETPAGVRLVGDPTKLRQVLINLVDNGIKFTNRGIITVKALVENRRPDAVDLRFEVRDTGIGMTEEQQRRIFAPFVQADDSATRKYGGAGLGLSIAKSLVEAMGGTLSVSSMPGVGSVFSFTLPFATVPALEAPPRPAAPPNSRRVFSGEVLVCEDNDINQDVIMENLSRVGLTASIAADGRVAVDMVRSRLAGGKPFDLIFMDIHMPEMDGLEATRRILALGVTTPIIALTANVMPKDRAAYREAGMLDCLGKLFQAHELWELLQNYLAPVEFVPLAGEDAQAETPASPSAPAAGSRAVDTALGLKRAAGNPALYQRLLRNFARDNQGVAGEIRAALDRGDTRGDTRGAYRTAHSLKGVAGLIGAERLAAAAYELEEALHGGVDRHEAGQLDRVGAELALVLADLSPLRGDVNTPPSQTTPLDRVRLQALFDKLVPLLQSGDVDSLELLGEIRDILAPLRDTMEDLIDQLQEYNFDKALAIIKEIRAKIG